MVKLIYLNNMNKYSYISLLLALILGIGIGYYFSSYKADKQFSKIEKEHQNNIQKEIQNRLNAIEEFKTIIMNQELELVKYQEDIETLNRKLIVSNSKVKKQREEAKKLNSVEKQEWLLARYDSLPVIKPDSVTVPDTVASAIIDDLILKDGLVIEVAIKDSTISSYVKKDLLYADIILTHEKKDVEQDSVISKQGDLNKSLTKENDSLKREVKREKFKVLGVGGVGAVIIILLLI